MKNSTTPAAVIPFEEMTAEAKAAAAFLKAEEAKKAAEATKAAKKAAKEATKEAKKAASEAAKPEATKEAKAAARKAEAEAKKAAEKVAKAEAEETATKDKVNALKEAAKEAAKEAREGRKTLTIKAEAVRKGLNAAARALLEAAADKDVSDIEICVLASFLSDNIVCTAKEARQVVAAAKPADIIANYRAFSSFAVVDGEGRKSVAKATKEEAAANVTYFVPADSFTEANIFRTPANNKARSRKQMTFEAGQPYERTKEGYKPITKAEAAARIKAAKEEAARQAEAKAKAEAQAEADRKAGEKARKEAEKAAKVARAKEAEKAA